MSELSPFYSQLRASVAQWVRLSEEQWLQLAAIFKPRTVAPATHLLHPGDRVYEILFVCKGLLRFYYADNEGTESNKAFIAENMFAGPLAASALDLPVLYGVQALEETTVLAARYADFVALFETHPVFDRLGRKLAEWLLIRKEIRQRSLLQQNATERYLAFIEDHPSLVQRVPQYHIASYLGITEVSLSRLRRALSQVHTS